MHTSLCARTRDAPQTSSNARPARNTCVFRVSTFWVFLWFSRTGTVSVHRLDYFSSTKLCYRRCFRNFAVSTSEWYWLHRARENLQPLGLIDVIRKQSPLVQNRRSHEGPLRAQKQWLICASSANSVLSLYTLLRQGSNICASYKAPSKICSWRARTSSGFGVHDAAFKSRRGCDAATTRKRALVSTSFLLYFFIAQTYFFTLRSLC